jgi:hypothetical protein
MAFAVTTASTVAANDGDVLQLTATVTTVGSQTAKVLWTQVSGPGCAILDPEKWSTIVLNLYAGTYVFQITATDQNGNTTSATTTVTVSHTTGPVYSLPTTYAGAW